MSIATDSASYATNGTEEKFWSIWHEKFDGVDDLVGVENFQPQQEYQTKLQQLKNQPLSLEQKNKLFAERFRYVRSYFDALEGETILPTKQDEYLYNLCRPERLMDLIFNFVLYDNGEKKIARYQQYFVIKKTIHRILQLENGRRKGGVVWHTQGSGKSLTMVMLAQAIALEKQIRNPKIILVTDRIDLDDQITGTFRKCGMFVENATTGQRLVELMESKSDAVVTTVINKFEAAVKKIGKPLESHDIFVLVDEGHRTQHGTFNIEMQKSITKCLFYCLYRNTSFQKR